MTAHRPARSVLRRHVAALLCVGLVTAGGCRTQPASSPPPASDGVTLDASQAGRLRVETLSAAAYNDTIKATGAVEFNADRIAKLLPPVAGQVQELRVNVGDRVRGGDVLFVLRSREAAAAIADHVSSQKDVELAEKVFAMTQDLFEHQAASRIALQQSESELAKARSRVEQTAEVLQVLGLDAAVDGDIARLQARIPVRSPIAGTVIERSVTNGQFVGPDNPPLVTIADLSDVWVEADVFERDLRLIAVGQRADVTTTAYPADRFSARVSHIGSVVDVQTRTAKVRFLVSNPGERLKPGMFASIGLQLPAAPASLTVPVSAIFVEDGQAFAYVQAGSGQFVRRPVATLAVGTDRLRVVSGLAAGDRVVRDDVLLLRQMERDSARP